MEWSKIYSMHSLLFAIPFTENNLSDSDIIHLDLAGTSVIVLSTLEATEALLEKRSSIYSDR